MKLTSKYDREFLRRMSMKVGGWWSFMHGANKDAMRLYDDGWLVRQRIDRAEGGYEYQLSDAGRAALAEPTP